MQQWTWPTLKDSLVGRLIDGPMKQLESYLRLLETTLPVRDSRGVLTTDATATTLATFAVPLDHTYLVVAYIVARRTGGVAGTANDGAAYRLEVVAKNTTGTAAEIAAETLTVVGESQAGWTVTTAASGGSILLQVTGAANNDIRWKCSAKTLAVKE